MESEFLRGRRGMENTLWRGGFLASYTVLANCSASEDLRQLYLPNRFNDSNRGVLASC